MNSLSTVNLQPSPSAIALATAENFNPQPLQPVTDVRGYIAKRRPVMNCLEEEPLLLALPAAVRNETKALCAMCFMVLARAKKSSVQASCRYVISIFNAQGWHFTLHTFRGNYDTWRKSKDWFVLVNLSRAGAAWQTLKRGLPERFLDFVAARMGEFKRHDAGEQAILSIHRQWRTGRNQRGEVQSIPGYEKDWENRVCGILPDGWHPTNIRRQLKARAKFTKSVKALLHEGIHAARQFTPGVHSTRAELRFLELIQFDDVRCDFRVLDTERCEVCDLWLLIARDVATTLLLGFGMRPALARDDGSQDHLKLQDVKQLFGWTLETYGLPPYRITTKMERGTTKLADGTAAAIRELIGADRLFISSNTMVGGKSPLGYDEKASGNSRAKAMLESLNRLQHLLTSHFPGQLGMNYGVRPAELVDREREALDIFKAHRPEDREELIYPVLTIPQARQKLFEIFRLQNNRTDHNCEGFESVVEAFMDGRWVMATTGHAGCPTRARMESPFERAARLMSRVERWDRVSPEIFVAFYEHTQRRVVVKDKGEIELTHENKLLRFAPPAAEFALPPETKCLAYFNPDEPRFLFLSDGAGRILGTWLRRGLVGVNNHDALAMALRYTTTALNVSKERAYELGAGDRAQLDQMREHNAGFVTVVEPRQKIGVKTSAVATALASAPRKIKERAKLAAEFDDEIDAALSRAVE